MRKDCQGFIFRVTGAYVIHNKDADEVEGRNPNGSILVGTQRIACDTVTQRSSKLVVGEPLMSSICQNACRTNMHVGQLLVITSGSDNRTRIQQR